MNGPSPHPPATPPDTPPPSNRSSEDERKGKHRLGTFTVLALTIGGATLGGGAAWAARAFDAGVAVQRSAAFACVAVVLLGALWRRGSRDEPFATAAALFGVCAVAVASLTYVGAVDADPAFGCVNTRGSLEAVIAVQTPIQAEARSSSPTTDLLRPGCKVHGDSWCVGAVHEEVGEPLVYEARWLILKGEKGLVPIGHTKSGPLPADARDDNCPGRVVPPGKVEFAKAHIAESGSLALYARAPGAAFVGFAVQRSSTRWERLGWDYAPSKLDATILPGPAAALKPGDEVHAVACVGYQQAATSDGSAVAGYARLERGPESAPPRDRASQPTRTTLEAAACDSASPVLGDPYAPKERQ